MPYGSAEASSTNFSPRARSNPSTSAGRPVGGLRGPAGALLDYVNRLREQQEQKESA